MTTELENAQMQYAATLERQRALRERIERLGGVVDKDRPYAPLYIDVLRQLNCERDRYGLLVLVDLACHADEWGIGWAWTQGIGDNIGYAPKSVVKGIESLQARGWLVVIEHKNPFKKQIERYWILHQSVLFIRPEIRDEQMSKFNEFLKQSVTEHIQPYTGTTRRTTSINQNHKPEPEPPPPPPRKGGATENDFTPNSATAHQNNAVASNYDQSTVKPHGTGNSAIAQHTEPTGATNTPPNFAAPPPMPTLPDGFNPAVEFDEITENFVMDIWHQFPTLQLHKVREWVAMFGLDAVRGAAATANQPYITNPPGKMLADLRRGYASLLDTVKTDLPKSPPSGSNLPPDNLDEIQF